MAGYGEYPSAYSNANGDDPMMRWYTQEEPWNSVAPSSTTSSADVSTPHTPDSSSPHILTPLTEEQEEGKEILQGQQVQQGTPPRS